MNEKFGKLLLFSFVVLMLSLSFFISIPPIRNVKKYENIINNGETTIATVIENSATESMIINDESYYYVEYSFQYEGKEYYGRTTPRYRMNDLQTLTKIEIKFLPTTFDSIEACYTKATDLDYKSGLLVLLIFGTLDVGAVITLICIIISLIKLGLVSIIGKKYLADFVSFNCSYYLNDVPMYNITYTWTDKNETTHTGVSQKAYPIEKAHEFELAGQFYILAYNDNSKIISKPNKNIRKEAKINPVQANDYCECEYCKAVYKKVETKCPNCGAPRKINKK